MKHVKPLVSATTLLLMAAFASSAETEPVSKPIVAPGEIAAGPFKPADDSLAAYQCPDWFRDAKFGIWSHWGPQAVPREGDWYAKGMYEHGTADGESGARKNQNRYNKYHLEHYGHPSKFGYKDIIPLWKAERLDVDQLMALYKKTGAKYFVSMGTHHDNFFLWDSKIHRWNAAKMGPMKDVVGIYQKAAKKQGMKFGVSEHLGASFTWFRTSHGSDADGPKKGVPYDGNDPQNQDLYHKPRAAGDDQWLTNNPADQRRWFDSIKELVDNYQPDLLYSDSAMPFGDVGRSMIAHLYNSNAALNGGKVEAVYNCKEDAKGKWVRDIERGVADAIRPEPWQTDTSIGDWYYRRGQKYMTSGEVIRMLTDIVSKNGNLLLNVVQTPEGDLEKDVLDILDGIGKWVAINSEGIYGTRPWKVFGEGPSCAVQEKGKWGGLKDVPTKPFTAEDFRFTASKDGNTLHAFCFGVPEKEFRVVSLGKDSKLNDKAIASVEILGSTEKVAWKQEPGALVVSNPAVIPNQEAVGLKVTFKP
jgi:alpha-L-fucosidase